MTKFRADMLALIILGALAFVFGVETKAPAHVQEAIEVQK
jgi:hypothetical protein